VRLLTVLFLLLFLLVPAPAGGALEQPPSVPGGVCQRC
jgi:hypothetical protein